jgi:general secretion pathway protein M
MSTLATLRAKFAELDQRTRLRAGIVLAVLLALTILYSAANDQLNRLQRQRASREQALAEMMTLRQRFQEATAGAQRLTNRLSATKADDSPAKLFEEIGIKGKSNQIRPMKGEDRPGAVEDAAEIKVEGLTANEVANFLHRLEKGSRPVVIKKLLIKARFEDPARLDVTLTVALLKPAAPGQR